MADEFPPWGPAYFRSRDQMLRQFLPNEPILLSAHYSTCVRYASMAFQVKGPQRMATMSMNVLQGAEFGQGWYPFMLKTTQDLFGTDNGAFIEIPRLKEGDPPPGINHLDSNRCFRTGDDDFPVNYLDRQGTEHKLASFQVSDMTDFPSPIEEANGMQMCAVSRVLKAAQIMRDIHKYKQQKISGRNVPAIYLLGGVTPSGVRAAIEQHEYRQQQVGNDVYTEPLMVTGYSPDAPVSVAKIEMASLPDNFNEETAIRMYLVIVANAYGLDYQDLAPLPGGNLGSGHQSQILDRKSKVKGPALFQGLVTYLLNNRGILPNSCQFSYGETDVALDLEQAQLALTRAQERAARIASTEISPQVAAQRALDSGDLAPEELAALGYQDLGRDVIIASSKEVTAAALALKGSKEWNFWQRLWNEPAMWQPHTEIVTLRSNP